ncbi:MAG: CBS domain-containing protein [Vicinamibacteria bacterium]|nr:CBS domain-containing protein [Vicinamibacteria bacterium]
MTAKHLSVSAQPTGDRPRPEPLVTRVKHIMTVDVVSVSPAASVGRIARLMHERAISGIPVVDVDRTVLGMVTDLDLILLNTRIEAPHFLPLLDGRIPLETPSHFKRRIQHAAGTTAKDLMTEGGVTVGPEDEVEALAALMVKERVNPVPVVEDGRLVGVVSRADVIRWMARDD